MSRKTAFYCRCGARLEGASERMFHKCPESERGNLTAGDTVTHPAFGELVLGEGVTAPRSPFGNTEQLTPLSADDPLMVAWNEWVKTPDFGNTRSWPMKGPGYIDGALWHAFLVGWDAAERQ